MSDSTKIGIALSGLVLVFGIVLTFFCFENYSLAIPGLGLIVGSMTSLLVLCYTSAIQKKQPSSNIVIKSEQQLLSAQQEIKMDSAEDSTEDNQKVDALVRILRDNSQNEYKRDAAMMDLAKYKNIRAIEALVASLARDPAVTHYQPLRASMALSQMNDKRAIPYLLKIIQSAEIQQGVDALTPAVSSAVKALGIIGDMRHVNVLIALKEKIMQRGVKTAYVNTGVAAGRISTMDQVRGIDEAIDTLKKK